MTDPPDAVCAAITGIQALLNVEPRQLLKLELDLPRLSQCQRRACAIARAIPPGQIRTYGEGSAEQATPAWGAPWTRPWCQPLRPGLTRLRMLAMERAVPGGTPDLFTGM